MRIIGSLAVLTLLAACAPRPGGEAQPPRAVGLPNPASVACIEQGGELTMVDRPGGQVGICKLRDGRSCEEWALFRDGRCVPG